MTTKWKPVGNKIMVQMDKAEVVSKSGIILAAPGTLEARAEMAQTQGTVIAVGDGAYSDQSSAWVKVGDRVMIAKYAGYLHTEGKDDNIERYRLIHDLDVIAVLNQGE
jgi:co-chaperonin GroES (HSP10)